MLQSVLESAPLAVADAAPMPSVGDCPPVDVSGAAIETPRTPVFASVTLPPSATAPPPESPAPGLTVTAPATGAHDVPPNASTLPAPRPLVEIAFPCSADTVVAPCAPVTSPESEPVKLAALPVTLMPAVPDARLAGESAVSAAPLPENALAVTVPVVEMLASAPPPASCTANGSMLPPAAGRSTSARASLVGCTICWPGGDVCTYAPLPVGRSDAASVPAVHAPVPSPRKNFVPLALARPVPPFAIGTTPESDSVGFWPPVDPRTPLAKTDSTPALVSVSVPPSDTVPPPESPAPAPTVTVDDWSIALVTPPLAMASAPLEVIVPPESPAPAVTLVTVPVFTASASGVQPVSPWNFSTWPSAGERPASGTPASFATVALESEPVRSPPALVESVTAPAAPLTVTPPPETSEVTPVLTSVRLPPSATVPPPDRPAPVPTVTPPAAGAHCVPE